jgi:hypothetical protein
MFPIFADDTSIANQHRLWRRVPPGLPWVLWDNNLKRMRITSAAYDDSRDGTPLSVYLEQDALASNTQPDNCLQQHTGFGMAALPAGSARTKKQIINRFPIVGAITANPCDPFHAAIIGPKTHGNKSGMAKASQWLIVPVG